MTHLDKSHQVGYDGLDLELEEELEAMMSRVPKHMQRNLQNRIHDGLLQRIADEASKRCYPIVKEIELCMNSTPIWEQRNCYPHRDALIECYHEHNTEENYQKYRIKYLRGELKKIYQERLVSRVASYKRAFPEGTSDWRMGYNEHFAESAQNINWEDNVSYQNIIRDDTAGMNIGPVPYVGPQPGNLSENRKPKY